MTASDRIEQIGQLLDAHFASLEPSSRSGVASRRPTDAGIPEEMWAGPVGESGWVDWKILPSTVSATDVSELESGFGIAFPPSFRAYLQARFHCFDQVQSAQYDQLILFPDLRVRDPFRRLREELKAWQVLLRADLIPFAEWGDAWGPMCFDTQRRNHDGECPILWLDHEEIIPLGERAAVRVNLTSLQKPLYDSFDELLRDAFGPTQGAGQPDIDEKPARPWWRFW